MHTPVVVILLAAVAAWIFGAAWYMGLGKPYQRALGLDPEACKNRKMPVLPLVVCFGAEIIIGVVLYLLLANLGLFGWMNGARQGLIIGAGLILTTTVVNNMFQSRHLALSLIDGVHWTLVLAIEGAVISALV